ncbi:hypothetical protein NC652_005803 [Populus alba x Populus x berolinensis]|nr:hypothetical protein NC652_005803 [Populus alba x Populus x berolinensis]
MEESNEKPDEITFLSVSPSACVHGGFVEEEYRDDSSFDQRKMFAHWILVFDSGIEPRYALLLTTRYAGSGHWYSLKIESMVYTEPVKDLVRHLGEVSSNHVALPSIGTPSWIHGRLVKARVWQMVVSGRCNIAALVLSADVF